MKYFKFLLLVISSFLFTDAIQGQIQNPASWKFSSKTLSDTEALLIMTATLDGDWHIYSTKLPGDNGPLPTEFTFEKSPFYKTIGEVGEDKPKIEYDPNFKMEVAYFSKKVTFTQKITYTAKARFDVKGEVSWMVCNDETCLAPEYLDFAISVKPIKESIAPDSEAQLEEEAPVENLDIEATEEEVSEEEDVTTTSTTDLTIDEPIEEEEESSSNRWLLIFLGGFGGGFAAFLMPCIYPMVPLTVSFFTKQSKTKMEGIKKALIYGFSIIGIYVLLGMSISIFFGSDALNALSTNPWFNLAFFVLFLVFAISFFGAFEITLPSSWVNKADEASSKGGLIGIFFMAFTLALVSFSCTGPIIGTLLVEAAQQGSYYGPTLGMFGFALALSIPFALFAAFPGWLNSMPRSGGWLNTVKVTLGFLELALAFKFLSNADLVWQAGWLKREMFIAIWVGISFVTALYLLGLFRMPHDSNTDRVSVPRLLFSIVFFIFGFYLLPGTWGAPVKLVAGLTPPMFYSEIGAQPPAIQYVTDGDSPSGIPDGAHPESCPHGLNCFHDFDQGLEYAKKVNKPILLDFTGWACANCRKMEENVWSDPGVLQRLRNNFVLISLYVDDREPLPANKVRISEHTGKKIKTVGNLWSEFQAIHYKSNAQPYYLVLGHESLDPLQEYAAYTPDIAAYIDWLDRGEKLFFEGRP
jgi:thiol:disulfide interchange protein